MRAWKIVGEFGLNSLSTVDVPEQPIKPCEVRVALRACSLNFRDLMVAKGIYNPRQSLPLVPLSDGAGEIIEVGGDVKDFKLGDKVCATFSQNWCHGLANNDSFKATLGSPLDGTLTQTRIFSEHGLIKFPDHLSFEEAATLPCAGVTAFNALALQASLKPGDTILLLGTGGVSLFALQFAKALGLNVIITSSSDDKLARVQKIYSCQTINYTKHENWSAAVLDMTDGQGVDAVVEVGGAKTINQAISSTKRGGAIFIIGVLSGLSEAVDLRPVLMNNLRLQGIFVGAKTVFAAMNRVIEHGKLRPVIDRVFEFDEARAAFSYLESAQHFGKVVIRIK